MSNSIKCWKKSNLFMEGEHHTAFSRVCNYARVDFLSAGMESCPGEITDCVPEIEYLNGQDRVINWMGLRDLEMIPPFPGGTLSVPFNLMSTC